MGFEVFESTQQKKKQTTLNPSGSGFAVFAPAPDASTQRSEEYNKIKTDLLTKGREMIEAKQKTPTKTPVSAVKKFAGIPFGQDIIQPYKEDSRLTKVGKGLINYGLGTATRAVMAPFELPANIINTVTAPTKQREYITSPTQVFPKSGQQKFEQFKQKNPIVGGLAENVLFDLVNPLTFVSGGIANDLARAKNLVKPIGQLLPPAKPPTGFKPDMPKVEAPKVEPPKLRPQTDFFGDAFGNVQNKNQFGQLLLPSGKEVPIPKAKTFTRSQTALKDAELALNEGIQAVENYVQHYDVLAAYPPGTGVEAALADAQKATGVNLKQLIDNYEQVTNVATTPTANLPKVGMERLRLGNVAGVRELPKLGRSLDPNQAKMFNELRNGKPLDFRKTVFAKPPTTGANNLPNINAPGTGFKPPTGANLGADMMPANLPGKFEISLDDLQAGKLPKNNLGIPPIKKNSGAMAAKMEGVFNKETAATLDVPLSKVGEGTGTADTFRSKINRNPAKKSSFTEFMQNARTQFIDDVAPLEKLEKSVRGKVASAEDSLYKQARLFKGTPAKANEIVRTRLAPIIKTVEDTGKSYKDLGDYALAVHARDVNAKGIQSGFADAEIADVIRKFGTPEMEAARQQLNKLSDDLLNELSASGVITQDAIKAMKEKYPNYMPLFRSFEDDKIEFGRGVSNALANVSSPIKKLKGSERDVIDPVESMVKNVFQVTNAAERNKVALQLSKLSADDVDNAFIRKLEPSEEVGRKNVVSVMEAGKKVQYEVEPEVYRSMLNLDQESSNFLIKILQKPAGVLRAGATLTPEFSLRNPLRDIVQAFTVSKSGFNPVVDFPISFIQAVGRGKVIKIAGKEITLPGKLYEQFLLDNGGYGNIVSADRNVHREALQQALREPTSKKFINVVNPKSWVQVLRTIADVSESATKLGEYRAALRSGASRPEAAYRARDLMDFARAGYSVRSANKIVAFLNANIQGKSKIIRAAQENPTGVFARGLASITLPTVGAVMAQRYLANNEQKRTIKEAPDWMKSTFWLVPVPGTDQVVRIPKPFDLAPIFANLPERLFNYIADNDPEAFDGFAKETFSNFSIPVMLTGFTPIIEGMANYSFFRQGSIIPERERNINFPDQYDINSTETAKFIASGVSKVTGGEGAFKNFGSPRIIDSVILGTTAGLGRYATNAVDVMLEKSGVVKNPVQPQKQPGQIPVLRSFLVNQATTGKSVDSLYKMQEQLQRQQGSAKLKREMFPDAGKLKFIQGATGTIGEISKQMRLISNSQELSAEEKRKMLDALNRKRNDIAIKVVEKIKNVENK